MARKGESIYKRKDGRWEARYIHHYENGKAKYRFLYAPTYFEAKAKRQAELSNSVKAKPLLTKQNVYFNQLASLWLKDIKITVKESTYTRYYRTITHYINPYIGDKPLFEIDVQYLNKFSAMLMNEGGINNKPLSPKTVTDILCVLKSIFRYGSNNGYACADISMLQYPSKKPRRPSILTAENRNTIEKTLLDSSNEVGLGILLALYTGIRIGELCGLRWEDIDLKNNTITIRRTVERIANLNEFAESKTKVIISEPKTDNSYRIIPLPTFLAEYMKDFSKNGNCYILTGTLKNTEPHQYYLRFKTFMKKNGLDNYTFHSLRHTFATRCVEKGFDIKSLSEILGHASVTTTLSIYVHPTLEQKRSQMELLIPEFNL